MDKNPFSSTLHLLYTKALHDNQHISYQEQLKKSALHVQSRAVLFDLIQTSFENEEKEFVSREETPTIEEKKEPELKESLDEVIRDESIDLETTITPTNLIVLDSEKKNISTSLLFYL